jgi:hypothetical protein
VHAGNVLFGLFRVITIWQYLHTHLQPTDQGARFTDLPEELIRAILLRLSDYKDLMNSGQACERVRSLLEEQHIWRELCRYHFTNRQIKQIVTVQTSQRLCDSREADWEQVFHNLRKSVFTSPAESNCNFNSLFFAVCRQFGLKEEYADSLFLCRHCRCLFWKTCGHPCLYLSPSSQDPNTTDPSNKENDQMSRLVNAQQVVVVAIPLVANGAPVAPAPPVLLPPAPAQGAANNPWQALFAHRNRLLAQQQQRQAQQFEEEEERFEYKVPDCIPISPEAFLKFFSL